MLYLKLIQTKQKQSLTDLNPNDTNRTFMLQNMIGQI